MVTQVKKVGRAGSTGTRLLRFFACGMVLVAEAQQLKAKIDTPKGGRAGDLLARAGQQAITACGPRSRRCEKFKKGRNGRIPTSEQVKRDAISIMAGPIAARTLPVYRHAWCVPGCVVA